MLPAAAAARILAPASAALLLVIYNKYFKSGSKTVFPEPDSSHPGGGGGGAPPQRQDDHPELRSPDLAALDPAVLDAIAKLAQAHLDENRNFNNLAVLDEILKLIRNFDPAVVDEKADDVVAEVEKLGLEENKQGEQEAGGSCCDGPGEAETQNGNEGQGGDNGVSFPAGECWTYLKTGTCKVGSNCKYNHPPISKDKQVSKDKAEEWEDLTEKPGRPESKNDFKSEGCKNGKASKSNHSRGQPSVAPVGLNSMGLPIPPVSKGKANEKKEEKPGRTERKVPKDRVNEREESAENAGQTECKYYLRPGGCKYGNTCRYSHSREKPTVAPVMDTNFTGLPIRPGERECAYYMRHGECKYGSNCRFSHPDPVAEGGSDPSSGYDKGSPALQGASEATAAPWSAPRSLNETPLYVPVMIPPSPGVPSQNIEWNGYQARTNLPERSMPVPQPYETTTHQQHPLKKQVEESPEGPGRPVCNFFSKTGYCHKSTCNYHHPKYQTSFPWCELSDKGLPLRPGQNICTQYSIYGICNSGPSCEFDHPSLPTFTL